MNSPITDIQLGADLVIKAVGEGVHEHLRTGGSGSASNADINRATESLRDLSRWQLKAGVLVMDPKTRAYSIDEQAIGALTDEQTKEGADFYAKAVAQHLPVVPDIYTAGKRSYVDYFSEVHAPVSHLIEPPIQVPTEASMDVVAKAALSFVEAAAHDQKAAENLPGVTRLDLEAMTDRLAEAGYLIPGENKTRDADRSLSEQSPRGTYEDRMAIFDQASVLAANAGNLSTIQGIDGPAIGLKNLASAVEGAEIEERAVFSTGRSNVTGSDSDLHRDDMAALTMLLLLSAKVVQNSQMSTDIEHHDPKNPIVVVSNAFTTVEADGKTTQRNDLLETFKLHLEHCEEQGIFDVAKRGIKTPQDFYVPDLARNTTETIAVAKLINGFRKTAHALADYKHEDSLDIDGDTGLRSLGGPHGGWESGERDEAEGMGLSMSAGSEFDREMDLDESESEDDVVEVGSGNRAIEQAADRFAQAKGIDLDPVESYLPEKEVDKMARILDAAVGMGLTERLGRASGRDAIHGENDAAIFAGNAVTSFAGYEDFAEGGAQWQGKTFDPDVHSFGELDRRSNDFKERLGKQGAIRIDPTRGIFKDMGYKSGAASNAEARVAAFVEQSLEGDKEGPNYAFRAILRKATERPVIAATFEEAQAFRNQGNAFVERENEELKLRLDAQRKKAGMWSIDVPRSAVERAYKVARAGDKPDDPFHVQLDPKGVTIYRDDAPVIETPLGDMAPDYVRKPTTKRPLAGMLQPYQMAAALQSGNGEKVVRVVMAAESVAGVTSQYNENEQLEAEKNKAKKPKGLEQHLPDVLG